MWNLIPFLVLLIAVLGIALGNEPIVISGAGPASLTFAHRFLRANDQCKIVIYEKRERPLRYSEMIHHDCVAGDNAFGFGLSQKAKGVLRKIPNLLESVQAVSQQTEFAPGVSLSLVNRRELCAELLHELEKEFGSSGRLTIHFEQCITSVDPYKNEVEVSDETETESPGTRRVPYSLLIGADGANSVIRSKLVEWGDIQCERYYSDATWKALQLPEQPNLDAATFAKYPKPFYKPHRSIKRDYGAILPRFKNRLVLLNFRSTKYSYESPFGAKTPQDLKDALQIILPNMTNFPSDQVLEEFLEQKPGKESFMKLDKHAIEKRNVALIGDASNGMYSLFGQGCASAMLQADMLADILTDTQDLTTALSTYSDWSVKEGHAIIDLNLLAHSLRQALPIKFWARLQRMKIGKTLSKQPEVPYSEIYKQRKWAIWVSRLFWRRARQPAPTRNME
jgi:2-polyprenyl-6-methoxyphenol hydroxylase-like FAD-dependent oxidoreductase